MEANITATGTFRDKKTAEKIFYSKLLDQGVRTLLKLGNEGTIQFR